MPNLSLFVAALALGGLVTHADVSASVSRRVIEYPNRPYSFRIIATDWSVIRSDGAEAITMSDTLEPDYFGFSHLWSSAPIVVRDRTDRLALDLAIAGYPSRAPTALRAEGALAAPVPSAIADARFSLVDAVSGETLADGFDWMLVRVEGKSTARDSVTLRAIRLDLGQWVGRTVLLKVRLIVTSTIDRHPALIELPSRERGMRDPIVR